MTNPVRLYKRNAANSILTHGSDQIGEHTHTHEHVNTRTYTHLFGKVTGSCIIIQGRYGTLRGRKQRAPWPSGVFPDYHCATAQPDVQTLQRYKMLGQSRNKQNPLPASLVSVWFFWEFYSTAMATIQILIIRRVIVKEVVEQVLETNFLHETFHFMFCFLFFFLSSLRPATYMCVSKIVSVCASIKLNPEQQPKHGTIHPCSCPVWSPKTLLSVWSLHLKGLIWILWIPQQLCKQWLQTD